MTDKVEVKEEGLDGIISAMDRASKSVPARVLERFERSWILLGNEIRAKVHVQTERLKLSGRSSTHMIGDEWIGEIDYDADPGIFELARGDAPSVEHPEGEHFFFAPFDTFDVIMEKNMVEALGDFFGSMLE